MLDRAIVTFVQLFENHSVLQLEQTYETSHIGNLVHIFLDENGVTKNCMFSRERPSSTSGFARVPPSG